MAIKPPKRILVVDDDLATLDVLTEAVAQLPDVVVTGALDGRQGLAVAKLFRPDVVLTDCVMPYMNGVDLIRAMRSLDTLEAARIIAITSFDPHVLASLHEVGADAFISKPLCIDELLNCIRVLMA